MRPTQGGDAKLGEAAGLRARGAALEVLQAVLHRRRPLDEALADHAGLAALATRDRAFARLAIATVLRRLGQIDALIAYCLARPLPEKAATAHDLLRLGVAQRLFLDTPAHAAVDTTVALAETRGQSPYKGLINAVLRRLDREGAGLVAAQDAARLNLPDWLWQSWTAAYGETVTRAIADAHLAEPPLDLSLKLPGEIAHWATRLRARISPLGTLRCPAAGPIWELPGYHQGAWWVQDMAATLPVGLLGSVAGLRVADLGAAPGGKTAQLAAAGARVTAVDQSSARLQRLHGNLARLGLTAESVVSDLTLAPLSGTFERVLLDAPCTATGTIRRHPDVPHLKRPEDVTRLARLQDRLLGAAVQATEPGGLLVYATCSLQPEEGPERIAALLASGAPVGRVPIAPDEVGGFAMFLTPAGDLRTLPCHLAEWGCMDGFFAARLRRLGP
ncbi:MAG: MFS transporter [Alphaproteobacteria bacterium]|nr:MFS transporter [Alphaproteobacteria bacterium]